MRKVTDAEGRYFCLVTPGTYYMTIEKKNSDGTYTLISNTPTMTLKSGYISKTLRCKYKTLTKLLGFYCTQRQGLAFLPLHSTVSLRLCAGFH